MSKAILVIDMPNHCVDCPCSGPISSSYKEYWCGAYRGVIDERLKFDKPSWCPLKEMPKRIPKEDIEDDTDVGWNACLDEILGDEDETN